MAVVAAPRASFVIRRATEIEENDVDFEMDVSAPFECSFICTDGTNSQQEVVTKHKEYIIKEQEIVSLIPGSLRVTCQTVAFVDDGQGHLLGNFDPSTGLGVTVANINYALRKITIIDSIVGLANPAISIDAAWGMNFNASDTQWVFRTPGNPITPGSFTVQGTSIDYGTVTGTADFSGNVAGDYIVGKVDYLTGSVWLQFGDWHLKSEYTDPDPLFFSSHLTSEDTLSIWIPTYVVTSTIVMNCVIESYLPLDAGLLGLNPVRLPLDGKVPIFKDGSIVLIHDTFTTAVNPTVGSQHVTGETNVALLELYGDAGNQYIPETGENYSVNLATGTLTMADPLDLSAYPGPYQMVWKVEDMILASDVQVTGHIALVRQVTHNYDASRETCFISSVLPSGDLQSGIYNEFFQTSWNGIWSDNVVGDPPIAQYNLVNHPIVIVNQYAVQERFACIITSYTSTTKTFNIVGEHLGVILSDASMLADISPINSKTGNPYFTILSAGWGAGWNTGNVFRFNSVGAGYPYWFCRTTLLGLPTTPTDSYEFLLRGDTA